VKYAWIERHRWCWPVSVQCEVLGVSPSGYHAHWRRRASPQQRKRLSNDALLVHIKAIHAETKGEYGWPRMWKELLAKGIRVGKERMRKLMALHGIKARATKKYKATTDSNHSLPDRGSQYCSDEFQGALGAYGMRCSMSRKADCWDNAPSESLWGSLKVARLHGIRFPTRRAAMDEVIDWMSFYNHRRLHSTLDYVSPMQFEQRWLIDQEKQAA